MIHTVYSDLADEVEKRLLRIKKKADRYNVPFSWTRSEEHPEQVAVHAYDEPNHCTYISDIYTVSAVDFDIDCDGLVKQSGWTVLAHIEHGEDGNIVTTFGCDAEPSWYSAPARCDHCHTDRNRTYTFIVEKDGERRMVGKGCLKDYTGISPSLALMFATVSDLFPSMECDIDEWNERGMKPMFHVDAVIAHACDSIEKSGFVSSQKQRSTRDYISERINKSEPTEKSKQLASEIIAWLIQRGEDALAFDAETNRLDALAFEIEREDDGSYIQVGIKDKDAHKAYLAHTNAWNRPDSIERDCFPLAKSGFCKANHFGRLAYIPVAYKKYLERKARFEAREAENALASAQSNYVGEIGQRITIECSKAELITSWETQYGYTYLYKFTDTNGNVFVWFASRTIESKDGMSIKGTVKDHNERDGVKQTILSRVAVI